MNKTIKTIINTTVADGENHIQKLTKAIVCKHGFPAALKNKFIEGWLMQAIAALCFDELSLTIDQTRFPTPGRIVFILHGKQGIGKTAFFRQLCTFKTDCTQLISSNAQQVLGFGEGLTLNAAKKNDIITAIRQWIVEIAALERFSRTKIANLDNFLQQSHDNIRLPYEKESIQRRRQTVFCSSINDDGFIKKITQPKDRSLSTRFGILPVEYINLNALPDAAQLWRQALDTLKFKMENRKPCLFWYNYSRQQWLFSELNKYLAIESTKMRMMHI